MATLHFSKEEKLELENNILKEQNLSMQIESIRNQRQVFINEFCSRNSQKPENIKSVDPGTGVIEFDEKEADNKKKK